MMVQTVTGPIPLERLGRTLMHEHLFIAFPGAEFDPTGNSTAPAFIEEAVRRLCNCATSTACARSSTPARSSSAAMRR